MTERRDKGLRADGGKGEALDGRGALADVRLRRESDRFRDDELSAREQRRAAAYGRARGRL